MIDPQQIEEILSGNVGGLKKIEITNVKNVDFDDQVSTVVSLPFRENTGELIDTGQIGPGGQYAILAINCQLPKLREDVRRLIRQWANTEFAVRSVDNNEKVTILSPARITYDATTGKTKMDSNNYNFRIEGIDLFSVETKNIPEPTILNTNSLIPAESDNVVNQEPPEDTEGSGGSGGSGGSSSSVCANIGIYPYQTFNELNANFENLPATYTLEVRMDGAVVSTSLPYTIPSPGVYNIAVLNDEPCEKQKGIYCELQLQNTNFTIEIQVNTQDNLLTAITNALNPSYTWELERQNGEREVISNAVEVPLTESGIYHLTITDGGSKTAYYLYQDTRPQYVHVENITDFPNPYRLIDLYSKVSGHQFEPSQIDLSRVNNPAIQIQAKRGTMILTYVNGTPGDVDEWTINNGKYEVSNLFPLLNEDLLFKLN